MDEFLDFYSKIYDREVQRSKTLNDGINMPVTIIGLFIGLMYYIFQNLKNIQGTKRDIIDIGFGLSFILIGIAVVYLALSFNRIFKGYKYPDLPKTTALLKYHKELIKYNSDSKTNDKKSFSEYLIGQFAGYSDEYAAVNDLRAGYLFRARKYIVATLFVQLITMICYLFL
jgi:hypothetical protein